MLNDTISLEDEIKKSYLEYSLSVIIGRAIPDARDGLKPVHRRILYAMYDLGNYYNRAYKKSARVVGDVIGKYHPHGDSAVYDALVRMAQGFNMRDLLVDGQGNFGSIDGDAPAAMRYTEVRMARLAGEFLTDIEKQTVNFRPNYDNTLKEPEVLPTKIPNLLINGSAGIAVGMATNIPPHNLGEIVDGTLALLDKPDIDVAGLMRHVKAPDFPTGAFLYGQEGIKEAYETGRGFLKIRGKVEVESRPRGLDSIVIKEIPYALNKASLVEKIAMLVNDKKLDGISDLRDESDRKGIRVVIDLKKGIYPDIIINKLYKFTALETSFGINMMAVNKNRPQLLNLKQILEIFLDHRREVILRRSRFDLDKAEHRAHILEGLRVALDNIDQVVELIKTSRNPAEAKERLIERFELSEIQSQAILDMRLQRLTNLEQEKILEEYREVLKQIEYLKSVIENPEVLKQVIRDELKEIRKIYATTRRTVILEQDPDKIDVEDIIPDDEVVITLSRNGYIKRTALSHYHQQRRGGKGISGANISDKDFITSLITTTNHQHLLLFSNYGRMYQLKVHQVPEGSRIARGVHIANLLPLAKDEWIATAVCLREFPPEAHFLFITRKGMVKRSPMSLYQNFRSTGLIALKLKEGDELIAVREVSDESQIFLVTQNGFAIRFACSEARPMGRNTSGVKGIALRNQDRVVSCVVAHEQDKRHLLTVSTNGFGKRTPLDKYRIQSRGGKGIINMNVTKKTGKVLGAIMVDPEDEIIMLTSGNKMIRIGVSGIRVSGRSTQGVMLVRLDPQGEVICFDQILPESMITL